MGRLGTSVAFVLRLLRSQLRARRVIALVSTMAAATLFDVAGLVFIFGYMNLRENPAAILTTPYMKPILAILPSHQPEFVLGVLLLGLWAFIALKCMLAMLNHYRIARTTYFLYEGMAEKLLRTYLDQDYEYHLAHNSAVLAYNTHSRTLNICSTIILPTLTVMGECVMLCGIVLTLLYLYPAPAAAALGAMVFVALAAFAILQPVVTRKGKIAHEAHKRLTALISDSLSSIREVKIYEAEAYFHRNFSEQIGSYATPQAFLAIAQRFIQPIVEFSLIGMVLTGSALVQVGSINGGQYLPMLVVMLAAAMRMLPGIVRISGCALAMQFEKSSIAQLLHDLELPVRHMPGARASSDFSIIALHDVTYRYPGASEPALKNVSLTIHKGEAIAIIGVSGSGKSTLTDILLGLIAPSSGTLLVDGKAVTPYQHLRAAYVPQTVFLTDDTLRNNIAFGHAGHDDMRLRNAMRDAHLQPVLAKLPDGLDTLCHERGTRFSGGERQRIAIARAFYAQADLIVLDEATSALDAETEEYIAQTLGEMKGKITSIVITHDEALMARCDRIITVKDGRIVSDRKTGDLTQQQRSIAP